MTTFAPRHVDIWPWTQTFSEVGTWARNNNNGQLGMGSYSNSATQALNDEVVYDVALDAGTWTITVIGQTNSSSGISTVYLDATSVGTLDWYSASTTNNVVKQITGITVSTPGVYALKLKMASKNASATAYRLTAQLITLTRTGA